ncbi:hypothetical protein [Pseudonocardia sp. GCM10023141]|uniref:hypothetical protein n=1 Tax=Pseudonocardia sp. GCM10023141 TaxID=3252653 RepID=UPI003619115F
MAESGGSQAPWTLLAVVLVAISLLTGCTEADAASQHPGVTFLYDAHELVAAVTDRQRADGTARLSLDGTLSGASTLTFTGAGEMRVVAGAVSVRFTQTVTQPGSPPQETGFVVLPGATYLRLPPAAGESHATPWVRVDPQGTDTESRQLRSEAAAVTDSADPMRSLSRYVDATLVSDAADDTTDGVPTVRYTIVVDLARAARAEPDPAVRAQLEQQVRGGLLRVTSTLWVDSSFRPVRSEVHQDVPGIGVLAITGSYRDWGRPVEIEAPPVAQVR